MDDATRQKLQAHWMSRALRAAREAFIASSRRDPMYLILDAALLAVPLWPDEPYFQRPTPVKHVGGVVRFRRGTKDRALFTNVFDPVKGEVHRIEVCEVSELVDNLGRLMDAIACTAQEKTELLDKVQQWISHDDTLDDTPDAESWARNAEIRRTAAESLHKSRRMARSRRHKPD